MRALWKRLATEPLPKVGDIVFWGSDRLIVKEITPYAPVLFLGEWIQHAKLDVGSIGTLTFPDLYEKGDFCVSGVPVNPSNVTRHNFTSYLQAASWRENDIIGMVQAVYDKAETLPLIELIQILAQYARGDAFSIPVTL